MLFRHEGVCSTQGWPVKDDCAKLVEEELVDARSWKVLE